MVANRPDVCPKGCHKAKEPVQPKSTARKIKHKENISFADPVVFFLWIVPLLVYGSVFVVAEMTGDQQMLAWLVAFIVAVVVVNVVVANHRDVWAHPPSLHTKTLLFLLATLIVGFAVPAHSFSTAWVAFVLLVGMLMYGVGMYYEYSSEHLGANVSSKFKYTSFLAALALIIVALL